MIAFAADLHLTPLTWNDYPGMRGDTYFAWDQIVAWCVNNKPMALILGGDVFDRIRPDAESVFRFQQGVDKIHAAGVAVLAIQGQHDRSNPPWTQIALHVQQIGDGKKRMIGAGMGTTIEITGYDCTSADILHSCLENDREHDNVPDVLVIHQLAKEAISFEGAWDFDQAWTDASLILAGDWHGAEQFGRVIYSGATTMRKISERGEKSFVVVRPHMKEIKPKVEKKAAKSKLKKAKKTKKAKPPAKKQAMEYTWDGAFDVQRIPLVTRDVLEFTIMSDDDLSKATERLAKPLSKAPEPINVPLVYARISRSVEGAITKLEELAKECGFFLRYDAISGDSEVVGQIELPEGEVTLETCLAQAVDPKMDEEFYGFALALLKSSNPKEVLDSTKARLSIT